MQDDQFDTGAPNGLPEDTEVRPDPLEVCRRSYAERRTARIERLRNRAAACRRDGEARTASARVIADIIPLGQPILVGHHSERRHRRDLERLRRGFQRGFELADEARDLERRADAAEASRAVSSDDPDAVAKLQEKLAKIQAQRARSVAVNKAVRSREPHAALGVKKALADDLLTPDDFGRLGIPDYMFRNLGAEARRLKARIAELERKAATPPPPPETIGAVRIEEADNRVRVFFPAKPAAPIRQRLGGFGFRFARSVGAWQQYASPLAWYRAREVAKLHGEPRCATDEEQREPECSRDGEM